MRAIAVIVPSYQRPEKLRTCLEALARQDGGPYRTIVVDDGSDMPVNDICRAAGDWVSCLRQENAGPAAARNAGGRAADGAEILCFTDDDCLARPDWIRQLVRAQGATPWRLVGGRIENLLTANVFAEASQSLATYLYDYYASSDSEMAFFTTNNMACRREDFLAVGGFDESFGFASEDRDFSLRWKLEGGVLAFEADAVVGHVHDLTLAKFLRQHRSYGRGAWRLHRAMDTRGEPQPKIEPLRFYAGLLTWPLRRPGRRRLAQSALIGLSQVAMVAGYLDARREARR